MTLTCVSNLVVCKAKMGAVVDPITRKRRKRVFAFIQPPPSDARAHGHCMQTTRHIYRSMHCFYISSAFLITRSIKQSCMFISLVLKIKLMV